MDLSPEEMKGAGISRVECPECATTRSLATGDATLRFPPRDKRKTSMPSRETRWDLRGTVWKLDAREKESRDENSGQQ
jgi:hypothetical protein